MSVKCIYCGGTIQLGSFEEARKAMKIFDQHAFKAFLTRKGVPYDPVSGAISIGGMQFFIDGSGCVMPDRPENLRQVVLRWINEYMSQD